MTDAEKWTAVYDSDSSYDGLFFYAVKSTGIYCRPSCRSKPPKRENVLFFDSAAQARAASFRPCKRCRSDLLEYQPIKEIAEKTKLLLDTLYQQKNELTGQLRELGVSQHRMVEIFREHYGVSLLEYANGLRLSEAKRLLLETDDDIIDIAYAVGFASLSAFYDFWKKRVGYSPAAYRKKRGHEDESDTGTV